MRHLVVLLMAAAALPAAASSPRFDSPLTQPAQLVATRPIASGGAVARLIVPVACATPTINVDLGPQDEFLQIFDVVLHVDYPRSPIAKRPSASFRWLSRSALFQAPVCTSCS